MNKKLIIILIFLVSLSFSATMWNVSSVFGNDVTGDGSPNNPYFSLSKAYNVSSAGDTITIFPGTYSEAGCGGTTTACQSSKRLNWTGNTTNPYDVNISWRASLVNSGFDFLLASSGTSISYLTINGTGALDVASRGIYLRNGIQNVTISHVNVVSYQAGSTESGIEFESNAALPQQNVTIDHCFFDYNDEYNIFLSRGNQINVTISNNIFRTNNTADISVGMSSSSAVGRGSGLLIQGNFFNRTLSNQYSYGVFLTTGVFGNASIHAIVRDNTFGTESIPFIGTSMRATRMYNVSFINNSGIFNNTGAVNALWYEFGSDLATVENNTFGSATYPTDTVTSYIIIFDNANRTNIKNNVIYNYASTAAIYTTFSSNITSTNITGNVIYMYNSTYNDAAILVGTTATNPNAPSMHDFNISSNAIYNMKGTSLNLYPIDVFGTNNSEITRNNASEFSIGIYLRNNQNLTVRLNNISNSSTAHLYFRQNFNTTIRDNSFTEMTGGSNVFNLGNEAQNDVNTSFFNNYVNITSATNSTLAIYLGSNALQFAPDYNTYYFSKCNWGNFINVSGRKNFSEWQALYGFDTNSNIICVETPDTTPPIVNLYYPFNGTQFKHSYGYAVFNPRDYNSENQIDSCSYSVNGAAYSILTSCNEFTFRQTASGTYLLNISVNDTIGNSANVSVSYVVSNLTTNYSSDLLLLLDFDENTSTEVIDHSRYGNNATRNGGQFGQGSGVPYRFYSFNGTPYANLSIADNSALEIVDNLSILTWFKKTGVQNKSYEYILSKGEDYIFMVDDTTGRVAFGEGSGTSAWYSTTEYFAVANKWNFVAVSANTSTVKFYANVYPREVYTIGASGTSGHDDSATLTNPYGHCTNLEAYCFNQTHFSTRQNHSWQYWTDQLIGTYMSAETRTTTVYNKGHGGDTCTDVYNRYDSAIPNNTMVILGCGVNQLSNESAEMTEVWLEKIYNLSVAKNNTVWVGMANGNNYTVNDADLCANYTTFNNWINTTLRGMGANIYDIRLNMSNDSNVCSIRQEILVDHVHMNSSGYKLMGESIGYAVFGGVNYSARLTELTPLQVGTFNGITTTSALPLLIGSNQTTGYLNGSIEELQLYNTTLTLNQINETFLGLGFRPLVGVVINPVASSTHSGTLSITWSNFTDPDGDRVDYNISLFNSGLISLQTIALNTTDLNASFDTTTISDGTYNIVVFGCDTTNLCSNASSTFFVDNTPSTPSATGGGGGSISPVFVERSKEDLQNILPESTQSQISPVVYVLGAIGILILIFILRRRKRR